MNAQIMLTSIEPEAEKIGTCSDCAGYFDAGKDTCKTCNFDLNSYNKPEEEEETDDEAAEDKQEQEFIDAFKEDDFEKCKEMFLAKKNKVTHPVNVVVPHEEEQEEEADTSVKFCGKCGNLKYEYDILETKEQWKKWCGKEGITPCECDDEDEPECCGKHCDETKGLKKAMCFNRYYENETDMVTEQLVCDKCFDDLTTSYCYSCSETYPYTEMEHKKGGRWGGGDFYCKSCVVSISSKNYNPDEYV